MTPSQATYATHYAPTADELRVTLPDVGESLHAQLDELSARPTPDGCDRVMISLAGAQAVVRGLHAALRHEGESGGR